MKVKTRLFVLAAIFFLFSIVSLSVHTLFQWRVFSNLLVQTKEDKIKAFDLVLKAKGSLLESFIPDYAFWDDMVTFVVNPDPNWAKVNIDGGAEGFKLSCIWVYSPDFSLVYSYTKSGEKEIKSLPLTKQNLEKIFSKDKSPHFFIDTEQGLMEIRGSAIHPSADAAQLTPDAGYLFAGKLWDQSYLDEVGNIIRGKLLVSSLHDIRPSKYSDAREGKFLIDQDVRGWDNQIVAHLHFVSFAPGISVLATSFERDFIFGVLCIILVFPVFFYFVSRWMLVPLKIISSALSKESQVSLEGLKKNGGEFSDIAILIEKFFNQKNKLLQELITHKNLQHGLRHSQERYQQLFSEILNGLALIEVKMDDFSRVIDYSILEVNPAFARVVEFSQEEIVGKKMSQLFPDMDCDWIDIFNKAATTSKPQYFECSLPLHKRFFEFVVFGWKDNKCAVLFSDITERRRAEEEMQESLRVRSRVTSMVSHELRTPLTAIKKSIEIMLFADSSTLSAEQKDFLDTALRNVERLERFVNDALDFQKLDAGKTKFNFLEADINVVVRDVFKTMESLAKSKGLELTVLFDNTIPTVTFDKDKITQVLANLIQNAIKFTAHGYVRVTVMHKGANVVVSVEDTGIGIKNDDIPRLFNPFEQIIENNDLKVGGTGLGLSISKQIIENHGGKIWVESQFQKGSIFYFSLPVRWQE